MERVDPRHRQAEPGRAICARLGDPGGLTRLVSATTSQLLDSLAYSGVPYRVAAPLGGVPVRAWDLRALAADAARDGSLLVVDNSLTTSFGCAALGRGADVAFEGACALQARDGDSPTDGGGGGSPLLFVSGARGRGRLAVEALPLDDAPPVVWEALLATEGERERRRRSANDAAQVVASYLRCHPAVAHVWYPGLRDDPSHAAAASILSNGFGPLVDFALRDGWQLVTDAPLVQGLLDRLPTHAQFRLRCPAGAARPLVMGLECALVRQG